LIFVLWLSHACLRPPLTSAAAAAKKKIQPTTPKQFFGAFFLSFAGSGWLLNIDDDNFKLNLAFSLLYVTLPVAVFRKLCYTLFVAPCFLHDKSKVRGFPLVALGSAVDQQLIF
jgi:hypothetical protein